MDEKGPMDQNMTEATIEPGVDRSTWSIMPGVFTAPAQAFADFNRRPKIAVVLIVTIIMGMIIGATTARYSAKMQYDLASRSTAIPAQALEQMQEKVEHPSPVLSALIGGAGQTIIAVIIALNLELARGPSGIFTASTPAFWQIRTFSISSLTSAPFGGEISIVITF
jgi:hypothetical protein